MCPFVFQNQRDQNYTVLKTTSNMMTIEGLKPGTTYVFRVRARTDGGYGSYSGEIELETSQEGNFLLIPLLSLSFLCLSFSYLLCCCCSAFTGKTSDFLEISNGSWGIFMWSNILHVCMLIIYTGDKTNWGFSGV